LDAQHGKDQVCRTRGLISIHCIMQYK
jgi:hypothetical protein